MGFEALGAGLEAMIGRAELTAARYNVDPRVFALLYVGSIPPYLASIAWLVRRRRGGGGIALPALSTLVFFALPALYILAFGRDLPPWVRPTVIALLLAGGFSARREVRRRMAMDAGRGAQAEDA